MKCPRCHHQAPVDADFCTECGARIVAACAACGAANEPTSKFCKKCGRPLGMLPTGTPAEYTPPHLAEKILKSREGLEGERKQVTVLFADLKGSMELLADRDPEEARKILDPVLERLIEAVHRYEGTVNQVMGDGIMALFGAPLAHEDHAVRACYAALRMQEAIRRYSDDVRPAYGVDVQIRVGINSGEVVVRSISSDLHMDYTAVGQTTNLAARMEQLATPGTTRITVDTLHLAEGYVQVRPLGPIPVKGVAERIEVYELTGAGLARTRLQAATARGLTRFIGRDSEMHQLAQAAEQARKGRGQIVAVVGEPGVGKSRLFYEFVRSHRTHGWLILESQSVSYGKATPFLPLVELLNAYFKIGDRDEGRTVRSKVTGTMLTLDEGLKDHLAPVLWLLEALPDDHAFLAFGPAQRRQLTLEAIRRLLLLESRAQPLLVVFEDLHWVDGETQSFLDSLAESVPTAAILLAVNYRPEYQHRWSGKTYYCQLRIDPLRAESADELLAALLGDDGSLGPLRKLLIERTDGNPLFLEEGVRALVETQALAGERGAYRLVRAPSAIDVPPTVQAILASRIDRLPPEHKRLLQAASVVGKDVPFVLLQAIAGLSEVELRRGLWELQAGEFLYEARLFPDLEYTFKHALTHEVAYGGLLAERRRAFHAAILEALEGLYADRLGEHVETLAHHATRGDLPAKAVRYLRQAGARAAARSANTEAARFFEQALGLLDELPSTPETLSETLDTRIALGPVLITLKGGAADEVEASYVRAQELVDRLGDQSRRFPVLWGFWYNTYVRGHYPAAREAGERLLEVARSGEDTGQLLEAHHALWPTLSAMGLPTAAKVHMEHGRALYERERHASQTFLYGGHDPGACCRYHLALTHWLLGRPEQGVHAMQDAMRLSDELNHPLTTAITLWFAVWLWYQRGEPEAATATAQRLLALATEHRFSGWTDAAMVVLPLSRGERLGLTDLAELHRRILSVPGANWRRVFCFCVLAELYADAGHPEEGRRLLASISEEDRGAFYAPEVLRIEGELLLRGPQPATDAAERSFGRAIDLARRRDEKSFELRATMSLARLLEGRGRRKEVRGTLGGVYGWFTEGFDTRDLRAAKTLLADLA